MLRLVHEPGLREKLRLAGFEQAKKFSWETSAKITLEVFEKVMEMQDRRLKAPARRRAEGTRKDVFYLVIEKNRGSLSLEP